MNWVSWWPVFAVFSPSLLILGLIARSVIREGIKFLRSRGEESGVPDDYMRAVPFCDCEDCDDLMAVADAVEGDEDDWPVRERLLELTGDDIHEMDRAFWSIVTPKAVSE